MHSSVLNDHLVARKRLFETASEQPLHRETTSGEVDHDVGFLGVVRMLVLRSKRDGMNRVLMVEHMIGSP